ncbi:hypothetical protein SNEBB_003109 [Seison nebaliae]|nr:hypothetical protein SNEBB_003109 [Seison nebaliae]
MKYFTITFLITLSFVSLVTADDCPITVEHCNCVKKNITRYFDKFEVDCSKKVGKKYPSIELNENITEKIFGRAAIEINFASNELANDEGLPMSYKSFPITKLNLADNQFTQTMSPDYFAGMDKLNEIDLSGNNFKILPKFNLPTYVVKLNLSGNKLNHLSTDALKSVNLRQLDLSHNEINLIYDKTFNQIKQQCDIDLRYNQLKNINPCGFSSHRTTYQQIALDIRDNGVNCNCDLFYSVMKLHVSINEPIRCQDENQLNILANSNETVQQLVQNERESILKICAKRFRAIEEECDFFEPYSLVPVVVILGIACAILSCIVCRYCCVKKKPQATRMPTQCIPGYKRLPSSYSIQSTTN